MANAYKNARLAVTDSMATIYTCPAVTTAIVLLAQATNVDGVNSAKISLQWLDSSNTNAVTRLANLITVDVGVALGLLDGKLVLEAGDVLQAQASAVGDLELTVSVLELT